MEELEGAKDPQAEGDEPTPSGEGAEPTGPEGEPTVGKTYTETEFRHELDKALGKGLESLNRLLSKRDKDITAKSAEIEDLKSTTSGRIDDLLAELEDTRREHQQALQAVDDPDVKKSYSDRVTLAKREREAARREKDAEAKLYKAEMLVHTVGLEAKAKALHDETGVPIKELSDCNTEDEMEVKALRYQVANAISGKQPQSKETPSKGEKPKFDSGASSGSGGLPEHPTPEQMEKWTPEQYAKWAERRYK